MVLESIQSHGWSCDVGNSFTIKETGLGSKTSGLKRLRPVYWISRVCQSSYFGFSLALSNLLQLIQSQVFPLSRFSVLPVSLSSFILLPFSPHLSNHMSIPKGLLSASHLFSVEFSPPVAHFTCMFHNPETTVYLKLLKCGGEMPIILFN